MQTQDNFAISGEMDICRNDDDYTALLYRAVFRTREDEDDHNTRGVLEALNKLTERERRVLEYRFRHVQTLDYVGSKLGVSRERARQIEREALRKLRNPTINRDMSVTQIEQERDMYKQRTAELTAELDELRGKIASLIIENKKMTFILQENSEVLEGNFDNSKRKTNMLERDVSEMDLSVRAFNCLWRAGLKKIRDIYELPSPLEFRAIRNFGVKSQIEVIYKMRAMGFTEWSEKMSNYRICEDA